MNVQKKIGKIFRKFTSFIAATGLILSAATPTFAADTLQPFTVRYISEDEIPKASFRQIERFDLTKSTITTDNPYKISPGGDWSWYDAFSGRYDGTLHKKTDDDFNTPKYDNLQQILIERPASEYVANRLQVKPITIKQKNVFEDENGKNTTLKLQYDHQVH